MQTSSQQVTILHARASLLSSRFLFLLKKLKRFIDAPSWPIFLLGFCTLLLVTGIIGGTSVLVFNLRDQALTRTETTLADFTGILSAHVSEQFKLIENIEIQAANQIATLYQESATNPASFASEQTHLMLEEKIAPVSAISSISVVGSNGELLNSSGSWPTKPINLSGTDYFRSFQSNPALTSYISKPMRDPRGSWKLYFARKIEIQNGKLNCIIAEEIDLSKIGDFFLTASFGQDGSISLFRDDGVMLIRRPHITAITGKTFTTGIEALKNNDRRSIRIFGKMDNKDRLLNVQRIKDFPLVVVAGIAADAALMEWRQQAALLMFVSFLSAITIGSAFLVIVRKLLSTHKWSKGRLALEKLRLTSAINNMSQGLLMFDASQRVVVCNDRYREIYGLSAQEAAPGCTVHDLLCYRAKVGTFAGDPDKYIHALQLDLSQGKATNVIAALPDGRIISVVNQPMTDGGWVATHEDITARRRAEQRIAHLAHHDSLTKLLNRATFNDYLAAAIDAAAKDQKHFALLSLDLDKFKEANDVYGHQIGDALLRAVAERLKNVSTGSFLFRVGGDEFAVIVTESCQPSAAETIGNRLLDAFSEEFEVDGHRVRLGVCIGGAIFPLDGSDAKTLLANADAALYQAKKETRGSLIFFEHELGLRLRERRDLQNDLKEAIERGELFLQYQPQKKITSGETIGFESLIRWQCHKRGLVPPNAFIPLAEESGLILPIGEWVLREACQEAASWRIPLTIAVNVSAVQFLRGDLPKLVHSVLIETGLPPSRLELEITESVMIGDFSRVISILCKLKALGVKIAMDDFGSGYSSLSYLHAFPFDKIKIDKTFVHDIEQNKHSLAIVRAVVGLGNSLGVPVLAEGVEHDTQLRLLAKTGCDAVQGHLTGKPQSINYYAELIGRVAAATTKFPRS